MIIKMMEEVVAIALSVLKMMIVMDIKCYIVTEVHWEINLRSNLRWAYFAFRFENVDKLM